VPPTRRHDGLYASEPGWQLIPPPLSNFDPFSAPLASPILIPANPDKLHFFVQTSLFFARVQLMKELKCFRRDERMPVQNLGSLRSDRAHVLPPAIALQPITPSTVQPVNRLTVNSSLITYHLSLAARPCPQEKIYFLQNEPNLSQWLPRFLEKLKAKKTQFKPN
jgi:hypothetical protein